MTITTRGQVKKNSTRATFEIFFVRVFVLASSLVFVVEALHVKSKTGGRGAVYTPPVSSF